MEEVREALSARGDFLMGAVAIIPARSGSKRIPLKNIRLFHGKPIIAYSIMAAQESELFDEVWVSTEDSRIGLLAQSLGAKWYPRPVELADDQTGTQEVTAECLRELGRVETWKPDIACCIYATAPLMTAADLRYSFELFVTSRHRYMYVTGWYYWGNAEDFAERPELAQSLELDRIVGKRWIDINTEDDWKRAEQMYAALHA